jgi:FHA domain
VSPLSLKIIQIGFLVLLWVLVLSVAVVMRSDLFARRRARTPKKTKAPKAAKVARTSGSAVAAGPAAVPAGAAGLSGPVGAGAAAAAAAGAATATTSAAARATDATAAGAPARPQPPSRPPKPRRGAPRELVVTAGTAQGTRIELGANPLTIGRSPENTLVLDDDYVSGRHARLFPHEGTWVVEDLGSTNGTYLDHTRLTSAVVLPVGTPIRIGKTVLELRK